MESIATLAPYGVSSLIAFLAYGSQILFPFIEPYGLTRRQAAIFNVLVACIWICYRRACMLDPGRVPSYWEPISPASSNASSASPKQRSRWCKRCEAYKPPRSHHCKTCKRCIPKMDHHCPWTVNCVSHRTLPSFMRFLFYATASMTYLQYFLYQRAAVIWHNRDLPSYLGPTSTQLVFLFILIVANSLSLFVVGIMFVRSVWSLSVNTTTIEGWEIDRHEVLVRRAKVLGGYLEGPDGMRIRIKRQEFPYDIGIWSNLTQGMNGTPLTWFWPLAAAPPVESGLVFEVNGFEDDSSTWPPPDPDRISRRPGDGPAFTYATEDESNEDRLAAFKARQQADIPRMQSQSFPHRRRPFHERYEDEDSQRRIGAPRIVADEGEEAWRSLEGERLADFGLDEEAEFYDEDEVPLAQLIQTRRSKQH